MKTDAITIRVTPKMKEELLKRKNVYEKELGYPITFSEFILRILFAKEKI